jgi:Tudor domain
MSVSPVNGALKQKLDMPRLVDCKLPPINAFFNVYITVASNPSFFMVQSYDDLPKYNELMSQLQTHCGNRKEYIPSDMIEVGQAYAGFHVKHNVWYR